MSEGAVIHWAGRRCSREQRGKSHELIAGVGAYGFSKTATYAADVPLPKPLLEPCHPMHSFCVQS